LRVTEVRSSRFGRDVHLAARQAAAVVGPEDELLLGVLGDVKITSLPLETQAFLARLLAEPLDEERYARCLIEGLEASAA
jgi:hypothetical protein